MVGALGSAALCRDLGTEAILGGVTWERLPIDPVPGPRTPEEIIDARTLAGPVLLAGPHTRTIGGAAFAEARMAEHLGRDTVLVSIDGGPRAVADGLEGAARSLGCDLLLFVDVGGDVLGDGSEPGLASPLCDAVMLAAGVALQDRGVPVMAAVFGPCCDGELTIEELLARLARVASDGGLLGTHALTPAVADEIERAARVVPTEASLQAVRCARGESGPTTIRSGRRRVVLSPLGAMTFFFDPRVAVRRTARLAGAVANAAGLEEANDILNDLGVRTELDYERANAGS